MEMVRKYVDADSLMSIMTLPETFKNRRLEVIVFPTDENEVVGEPDTIISIVDSLIGVIPDTGLSLSEFRDERLKKYEIAD